MKKVMAELNRKLAGAGIKSSLIPVEYLSGLKSHLESFLEQGMLNRDLYDEIVSRYDKYFDFQIPADFPTAQSILIAAVAQPKTRVEFKRSGKTYPVIVPPTYLLDTAKEVWDILSLHLGNHGYRIHKARLPEKLLAVRSGLARYGRNNIAYIDGWGSFFRPHAFFSDMPCAGDNWHEVKMLDRCSRCTACIKNCPTKAISEERFLVDADRCITNFNEMESDFPAWIDPTWHNCLIGCMKCQDVCPENKDSIEWVSDLETFSEQETAMIIDGVPKEQLPNELIKKLEKLAKIFMLDNHTFLRRNLSVLL